MLPSSPGSRAGAALLSRAPRSLVVAAAALALAAVAARAGEPAGDGTSAAIERGVRLHDEGRYDEAVKAFQAVLASRPDDPQALYELSITLAAKGDLGGCVEAARHGLKVVSPYVPMLYASLGNCLDGQGQGDAALTAYRAGLKRVPDDPELNFNLGVTLAGRGQDAEARAALERAISSEPGHASANYLLGMVAERGGARVIALCAYLRFLSLEPSGARAQKAARAARVLLEQGVSRGAKGTEIKLGGGSGDESALELMMGLAVASAGIDEGKLPEAGRVARELSSFLAMTAESHDAKLEQRFVGKAYLSFFARMHRDGHADAFGYVAFSSLGLPGAQEWLAQHGREAQALGQWLAAQGTRAPPAYVIPRR